MWNDFFSSIIDPTSNLVTTAPWAKEIFVFYSRYNQKPYEQIDVTPPDFQWKHARLAMVLKNK